MALWELKEDNTKRNTSAKSIWFEWIVCIIVVRRLKVFVYSLYLVGSTQILPTGYRDYIFMIILNKKWQTVTISEGESELDLQFRLTTMLNAIGCECKQNCTIYVSCMDKKLVEQIAYWREKKTDRATRKKMFVDIFVRHGENIGIVEMKKQRKWFKKRNLKERTAIRGQLNKYEELWLPVFLCDSRESFNEILEFFKRNYSIGMNVQRPKFKKKEVEPRKLNLNNLDDRIRHRMLNT